MVRARSGTHGVGDGQAAISHATCSAIVANPRSSGLSTSAVPLRSGVTTSPIPKAQLLAFAVDASHSVFHDVVSDLATELLAVLAGGPEMNAGKDAGIGDLYIVNRTPERADALADALAMPGRVHPRYLRDIDTLGTFDLIVNATSAARDFEPLLAQGIRHGFVAETELAVDNRAVVEALAAHCERLGVEWAPPVDDLATVDADVRVIANGIDAPTLWPGLPVRPVKGEVLRLRWRKGCMPVPQRVIRARVHGRPVYLVPRADGVVVGATQYEHGRDTAPVVRGVRDLLEDACAELLAADRVFFEVTDHQINLEYVPPERRAPLEQFCAELVATIRGASAPSVAEPIG